MPTSNYSAFHPCLERVSATSRTAVYGPVRTVVWEGRSCEAPPYPDQSICRSFAHYLQPQPSSRRIVCHISATLDPVTRTHARDLRAKSVQPVELPDSD